VLPFGRFQGVDTLLGPEMKSTGEVMGLDSSFGMAFAKSQLAVYNHTLPHGGRVFVSLADRDKDNAIAPVKRLAELGFEILATAGTAAVLRDNGVIVEEVRKHSHGEGAHGEKTIVQRILNSEVSLIVNTPFGSGARSDGYAIRTAAVTRGVPSITTVAGLVAAVQGIEAERDHEMSVKSLQAWAADIKAARG
jgi:carbamoyl-phosphate synthase large subunit